MRPITSVRTALIAAVAAAAGTASLLAVGPAAAAPAELQFGNFSAVNTRDFTSYAYQDNGTTYFKHGRFLCRMGPVAGSVGCMGKPATAPPNTQGVAITQGQQGPWWVPPATTYRFTPVTNYRVRTLAPGQKISITNATCAVPRAGVVSCQTTGSRAFIVSRGWHKFYGPGARDGNPPARYLPANLR